MHVDQTHLEEWFIGDRCVRQSYVERGTRHVHGPRGVFKPNLYCTLNVGPQ